jgi:repressor LexA
MRPRNVETQEAVYEFINEYIKEFGVSPSIQEVAEGIGIAKSSISKYVNRLIEEGRIERYGRNQLVTQQNYFSSYQMPIVGAVACGKPKLAFEDIQGYIPLDKSLPEGEYFGLVADGVSMIDVGIHSGDIIFIRRQETADDGDIVVAMIEDEYSGESTATLKRFYRDRKHQQYILHPENKELDDIIVDKVRILGKAVRIYKNIEDYPI